eukprot:115959-Hanusia_phi.AAC.1
MIVFSSPSTSSSLVVSALFSLFSSPSRWLSGIALLSVVPTSFLQDASSSRQLAVAANGRGGGLKERLRGGAASSSCRWMTVSASGAEGRRSLGSGRDDNEEPCFSQRAILRLFLHNRTAESRTAPATPPMMS